MKRVGFELKLGGLILMSEKDSPSPLTSKLTFWIRILLETVPLASLDTTSRHLDRRPVHWSPECCWDAPPTSRAFSCTTNTREHQHARCAPRVGGAEARDLQSRQGFGLWSPRDQFGVRVLMPLRRCSDSVCALIAERGTAPARARRVYVRQLFDRHSFDFRCCCSHGCCSVRWSLSMWWYLHMRSPISGPIWPQLTAVR